MGPRVVWALDPKEVASAATVDMMTIDDRMVLLDVTGFNGNELKQNFPNILDVVHGAIGEKHEKNKQTNKLHFLGASRHCCPLANFLTACAQADVHFVWKLASSMHPVQVMVLGPLGSLGPFVFD